MKNKGRVPVNPWDYILPRDKVDDFADSTVIGLVGPKRSGKSLQLAAILYREMCKGRKVWSNMTVKTPSFFLKKGWPMMETMPINWDDFFTMGTEYQDGTLGIDEASYNNGRRSSMTSRSKVTNAFLNQIGHRNLDVIWTAKSGNWLDRQGLGFETDIEISCRDVAKTPWGISHRVKKGTKIQLAAFDRSGALTGRTSAPGDYTNPFMAWTWDQMSNGGSPSNYWDAYSTRELTGIEEIFGNISLDLQKRVITNKTQITEGDVALLHQLALSVKESGERIDTGAFWDAAAALGVEGNSYKLGRYLKKLGVEKKQTGRGYVYDVSALKEPGMVAAE